MNRMASLMLEARKRATKDHNAALKMVDNFAPTLGILEEFAFALCFSRYWVGIGSLRRDKPPLPLAGEGFRVRVREPAQFRLSGRTAYANETRKNMRTKRDYPLTPALSPKGGEGGKKLSFLDQLWEGKSSPAKSLKEAYAFPCVSNSDAFSASSGFLPPQMRKLNAG